MARLKELVKWLDDYLKIEDFVKIDDSWNGLQVEGRSKVEKVALAVTFGLEAAKRAKEVNADLLLVHHGLFWAKSNPSLREITKKRVELLLRNGISLYAAHLPLDAQPEIGNDAELLRILGAAKDAEFCFIEGKPISWIGKFRTAMPLKAITQKLDAELKTKCVVLPFGPEKIKTVAVVTGGGGYPSFFEAQSKKVDLYITGDTAEIWNEAKDNGINVIFAQHHATERLGVKALGKVLKEKFKVDVQFIDIPTGL
ncbi:MAG: Nif3-like dinuclear metal center hexameric protein [Candidatus Nanoarchaeia archaeon]